MKKYRNPNIPKPTPGDSRDEALALVKPPRYVGKPVIVVPPKKKTPRSGERSGPTTKVPAKPMPNPKPINKPGVKPPKRKTGPRPSNRNDIIRNRLRPAGSN